VCSERLTIDTTVARDCIEPWQQGHDDAMKLLALHRRRKVRLAIAPQGHRDDVPRDPLRQALVAWIAREGIEELPQLAWPSGVTYPGDDLEPGNTVDGFDEAWRRVARSWPSHEKTPPGDKDAWHVETHLAAGGGVFLTDDDRLLRMCRRLRDEHGYPVEAIRPADYLASCPGE
jgi:hypothetical protein